jgi:AcrR family transcriptional regulator
LVVATSHRTRLDAGARRETILAAAIPEFAASGYERTRIADIAAKVGVTEPVVFQNFGTKAGLFIAVLERMSEEVAQYLTALAERSTDVAKLLSALLAHEHQDRMHSPGGFGTVFAEAANSSEPSIRQAGRRAHSNTLQGVIQLLRRGQDEGSIRDDVDATTLGWLLLSQIHARQFRRAHSDTSPTMERAFLRALLAALRPPASRPGRVSSARTHRSREGQNRHRRVS